MQAASSTLSEFRSQAVSAWQHCHIRCGPPAILTAKRVAVALVAVPTAFYAVRWLLERFRVNGWRRKAVVVTGCDSGFGRLLALKCAREGMTVFAGCLTVEGVDSLEEESQKLLENSSAGSIKPVQLDVTDDNSVRYMADFVENSLSSSGQELWALVNNAGWFAWCGPDAWLTVDDYMKPLDVNFLGMVRCTHALLPLLKRSKGRVVFMSSMAGRYAQPYGGPYSVSKYAVEAYADTIRQELRLFGVTCCILEPGGFNTPFVGAQLSLDRVNAVWERLPDALRAEYGEEFKNRYLESLISFSESLSPRHQVVVNAYFHALTARFPRCRYRPGWDSWLVYVPAATLLPTVLQDALLRYASQWHRIVPAALSEK